MTGELLDEQAATFRSLLATVHTPQDEEQAHNSRIAAKRLRYLLEPLTKSVDGVKPLIKRLKRLQDILGELHDTHVLSTEIAEAIETVAAERARRLHELALEAQSSSGRSRRSPGDETRGLLALTRLLRERRDELFSALQRRWLGQKSDDFFQKVTGLALRLRHGGHDQHEVERRYLLSEVPDSLRDTASSVLISQGWLPGDVLQERLRRVRSPEGLRYYRTVKSGSGLNRVQLEEKISRRSFERLWPLTEGRRLRKRRYRRADAQLSWEIDEFLDRELVLAEVGLPSEDYPVQPPDWLQPYVVEEVTGDPAYENANLATRRPRSSPGRRSTPRPSPRPDPPD